MKTYHFKDGVLGRISHSLSKVRLSQFTTNKTMNLFPARSVSSRLNPLISRDWFELDIRMSALTAFLYTSGWILYGVFSPVNSNRSLWSTFVIVFVAGVPAIRFGSTI